MKEYTLTINGNYRHSNSIAYLLGIGRKSGGHFAIMSKTGFVVCRF